MAANQGFRLEPSAPIDPTITTGASFEVNQSITADPIPHDLSISSSSAPPPSYKSLFGRNQEFENRNLPVSPIIPQESFPQQQTTGWLALQEIDTRNLPISSTIPHEGSQEQQMARWLTGQDIRNRNLPIFQIIPQQGSQVQQTDGGQAGQGDVIDLFDQARASLEDHYENRERSNYDCRSLLPCSVVSIVIIIFCIAVIVIAAINISCIDISMAFTICIFLFAICNMPYWPLVLTPGCFKEMAEEWVCCNFASAGFVVISMTMFIFNINSRDLLEDEDYHCKTVFSFLFWWVNVMEIFIGISIVYLLWDYSINT